jgi:crotonobetainyl-CoA:carnitine CoA-transferase CaiB-like acyl-CoA transferase
MSNKSALAGIRVLDLSRLVPGPYATMLLADFGAEVVKIEEPGRGDYMRDLPGLRPAYETLNRHKKSVTLNLKDGKNIFLKLAKSADVLVESFRPGVMERLGLGYKELSKINKRLVYCSVTGYGQSGPMRDAPGHDINYLAKAGVLEASGKVEPTIPGLLLADMSGAVMAAIAILVALFARERTGRGQYLDVSMLDGLLSMAIVPATYSMSSGKMPAKGTLPLFGGWGSYNSFPAKDGRYVALGALEGKFWQSFCEKTGLRDLVEIQDEPGRQETIRQRVAEVIRTRTAREWEEMFATTVPVTAVQTIEEALRDPQVVHREMTRRVGEFLQIACPLKLSGTPAQAPSRAPTLGEHTEEVLRKAGYSKSQISAFRDKRQI